MGTKVSDGYRTGGAAGRKTMETSAEEKEMTDALKAKQKSEAEGTKNAADLW